MLSCQRFRQQHIVPQFLQFLFEIRLTASLRLQVDVVGPKFTIRIFGAQYMVDRLQDRMSYCDQGSLFAPSCCQSVIPSTVKCVLCSRCRPRGLHDHRFGRFVAVGYASTFFLPALSLLPGAMPTHEHRCFSFGNALISNPISATRSSMLLTPKPGTCLSNSITLS